MRTIASTLTTVALASWLGSLALPAVACGSDFVLGDEVSAAHPASIGVAFALHDAIGAGKLPANAGVTGAQARLRADDTAHLLEQKLAATREKLPAMALLLVESRLWTRYTANGNRDARPHADHDGGPADDDVVVVTGDAVLRGVMEGRMGWQQAVDGGLIVVVGEGAARSRVERALAARFTVLGGPTLARHESDSRR